MDNPTDDGKKRTDDRDREAVNPRGPSLNEPREPQPQNKPENPGTSKSDPGQRTGAFQPGKECRPAQFEPESDAVVVAERRTGRIIDVNQQASALYGYTRQEMLKLTAPDLSAEKSITKENLENLNGTIHVALRFHKKKDGTIFPADITARTFELDGKTLYLEVIRDITEQVRIETVLQESERNYREIFNSTNDAILIQDPENGELVDVSESALKMYGYSRKEEVLKAGFVKLMANREPYTLDHAYEYIQKTKKEGLQVFEWLAKKRNGKEFWVEVSLRNAQLGSRNKILAIIRDIDERKQTENELILSRNRLLQAEAVLKSGYGELDVG